MDNYLEHHGILGQKWGVRRYQNSDGSLTSEGRKHYGQNGNTIKTKGEPRRKQLSDEQKAKIKKAVTIGAIAAGTALAAYGTYKVGMNNPQIADAVMRGKDTLRLNANIAAIKVDNRIKNTNVKEAGKKIVKDSAKLVKEGAKSGYEGTMRDFGKLATSGVTWMAGIEVADLMTDGAVTNKILKAYNDHNKKNKMSTSYRQNRKEEDED